MENEFVPYEEAMALKELGFVGDCLSYYEPTMDGIRMSYFKEKGHMGFWSYFGKQGSTMSFFADSKPFTVEEYQKELDDIAIAPLYQQVFRWFRERGYNSGIYPYYDEYAYEIKDFVSENAEPFTSNECVPYEEAQLACLRHLIEIKKKHK